MGLRFGQTRSSSVSDAIRSIVFLIAASPAGANLALPKIAGSEVEKKKLKIDRRPFAKKVLKNDRRPFFKKVEKNDMRPLHCHFWVFSDEEATLETPEYSASLWSMPG